VRYRYWDSCVMLGWLKQEEDKIEECRAGIEAAEKGEIHILTSAFTLAEVLRMKKQVPIARQDRERVRRFFENEYILLADVDRQIAELAQDVVWDYEVNPKDAIHVATAMTAGQRVGIEQFDTFDGPLIAKSGKIGNPGLKIGRPDLPAKMF
jgi:predicted nucleic acid-binding protein